MESRSNSRHNRLLIIMCGSWITIIAAIIAVAFATN